MHFDDLETAEHEGASPLSAYVPRVASAWPDGTRWRALDGSLVFIDVSGFTALSERLAARGKIGAEELTDLLGDLFADLLALAYAEGGSLLTFGGDALLLLFEGDLHAIRAARAALRMRARLRGLGRLPTSVGSVRLRMSVGINTGKLHLFRAGDSHSQLILTGPAATATVEMEAIADAGEIVVAPETAASIWARATSGPKAEGLLLRDRKLPDVERTFDRRDDGSQAEEWIPVGLRDYLQEGGGDAEHRTVAVAFIHFEGADRLLDAEGPDSLAAALDALISSAAAAALREEITFLGTDIDRDGGKIILVAGAPDAKEDDAGRILRACRAVADAAGPLPVRIGVNLGHVFAGSVGPAYRRTYTVMGDAVNLAARLMGAAPAGEIYATKPVIDGSLTVFATTDVPPFFVKGKGEPVACVSVGAISGSRAARTLGSGPFCGRGDEVATLQGLLARAREGSGSMAIIHGDAGIGKTRLLEQVRATASDIAVPIVRCEAYQTATPFFVAGKLARAAFDLDPSEVLKPDRFRAIVTVVAPQLEEWLPLLGDVMGIRIPETERTRSLEPRFRRERTLASVADLLRATLSGPRFITIEDAQWMDDASSELLSMVTDIVGASAWLVCVTRRDVPGSSALGATLIELGPLDASDASDLVTAAAADQPLAPHDRDALLARAQGNPLFIEELVRARTTAGDLPDSLGALISARIDRLAPSERRLLRSAAVLGTDVDVELLEQIAGQSVRAVLPRLLESLESVGPGVLRFRHRLLRDVAYDGLPFKVRRDLHGRAAAAIESSAGENALDRSEILSLHFFHAGQDERCWFYGRAAGVAAQARYANVEAVELFDRAITGAQRSGVVPSAELAKAYERLGDVAALAGLSDRAAAAYRKGRTAAIGDPVTYALFCSKQAWLADRQGRGSAAARWISAGIAALKGRTDRRATDELAELFVRRAFAHQQAGRPRHALRWAGAALDHASANENRRATAEAYMISDWANLDLGRPAEATKAREALALWDELGEHGQKAVLLNNLGGFAYYQGDWDGAMDRYREAREAFEAIGDLNDATLGTCNIAEILIDQGRIDEAMVALEDATGVWRSTGFHLGVALASRHLGRALLHRGDVDDALEQFAAARATLDAYGMGAKVVEVDTWIAECRLRQGDADGARVLIDETLHRQESVGGTEMMPMLYRLRAYALCGGDRDAARGDAQAGLDSARARGADYEVAACLEALDRIDAIAGQALDPARAQERTVLLARLGVMEARTPPV